MRRCLLLLVLLCAVPAILASCGDEAGSAGWTPTTEDTLTLVQKQQRKRAFGAKDVLSRRLSNALMGALQKDGPAAAVEVCRTKAPEIAAEVAKEREVKIGRTSYRLRNPDNRPPGWAEDLVARRRASNAYVLAEDGRFGALLPIRLQNMCLACHGDPAEIPPGVKAKLAEHYPEDAATGFARGDLRGWFWVEVPATRTAPR